MLNCINCESRYSKNFIQIVNNFFLTSNVHTQIIHSIMSLFVFSYPPFLLVYLAYTEIEIFWYPLKNLSIHHIRTVYSIFGTSIYFIAISIIFTKKKLSKIHNYGWIFLLAYICIKAIHTDFIYKSHKGHILIFPQKFIQLLTN